VSIETLLFLAVAALFGFTAVAAAQLEEKRWRTKSGARESRSPENDGGHGHGRSFGFESSEKEARTKGIDVLELLRDLKREQRAGMDGPVEASAARQSSDLEDSKAPDSIDSVRSKSSERVGAEPSWGARGMVRDCGRGRVRPLTLRARSQPLTFTS
jgi:hypothetical protein